jgi:competence protein ComEC
MPLVAQLEMALLGQRGHLFPWIPVFLAAGIGGYFTLRFEPQASGFPYLAGLMILAVAAALMLRQGWSPLAWAVALVLAGFCLAAVRAHVVDRPVLGFRFYGPVEGRIVGLDRSGSDAVRITLDQVRLGDLPPSRTPERVRLSLHDDHGTPPRPGARVMATAHLSPPGGPVEPGGFDFQRHAWFLKLGAVGYTRTPLMLLEPPASGQALLRTRLAMSARVQQGLGGETGAFAAAIMTGDRAGMGQDTLKALRATNLAHLLAISGLHMGLLTAFVFTTFRLFLTAMPWLGLRVPVKKLAALMALLVAAGYLALSGGNVATERAFVMVAVALLAVVADRRVISLRAVAMAATIVLFLRPEALLGPGFQMSFAATAALVAVFGWLRDAKISFGPDWAKPVVAVVISSAVAGAATAPIAAAHFNQISHFGLIANLLSVPLMGVLVIPAGVVAALLMPLGLEQPALWVMGLGLDWILGVANVISGVEGTRGAVPSPDWRVLPLMAAGFVGLILWQGRARLAGLGPVAAALMFWVTVDRPDVLIADGGTLVGVMGPEGRALSKPRGAGFVAQNWLENDGDPVSQDAAAGRWPGAAATMPVALRHVTGKTAMRALECKAGEWVVTNVPWDAPTDCEVYDPARLRRTGAMAVYAGEAGAKPRVVTARQITGERLWNRGQ